MLKIRHPAIIKTFKSEAEWISKIISFIKSINPKIIALSGGSTPKTIYKVLAKTKLPWEKINFYQVDERYVPKTHPESNYRLIHETLIKKTAAPFHFFDTSLTIKKTLKKYAKELPKQFDLVILGIGEDGHIASLFPNSKALNLKTKTAHTTTNKFAVKKRLTVTFSVILKSKNILVLLKNKPEVLKKLKNPQKSLKKFPANRLLKNPKTKIYYLGNSQCTKQI